MGWLNQYIHEEPSDELVEPGFHGALLCYYGPVYLLAVMVSANIAGSVRTNERHANLRRSTYQTV
jgi:hypothetical protein